MKKSLLFFALIVVCSGALYAQGPYRTVTVHEIQFNAPDSLLMADTLQNTVPARWTLQASSFYRSVAAQRETVEVVVQVVVPPKVITFTGGGFTLLVRDTAESNGEWEGLFGRVASGDTTALINAGFLNLAQGDIIRMRGFSDEFPTLSMNSFTQFVPIAAGFQLLDNKPVPPIPHKSVTDFYKGIYPSAFPNGVRYSTGEPFEAHMVEFTNLTITGIVNFTNGTFAMVDTLGNEISMLDVSKWFTLRVHKDPTSTYTRPPIFAKVDTIRGYLTTNSGSENNRGYRISPVFPGDLVIGKILPLVDTHRRNPVAITSTDTAKITVRAYKQTGGYGLRAILMRKSFDNGPFSIDTMKASGLPDSTYLASIVPQAENTMVKYYFEAVDSSGSSTILASSATGVSGSDTSRGLFFYTVLDRALTVRDIQYTPFLNGRTPYLGGVVNVSGIITADTSDIKFASTTSQNSPWYLQTDDLPWGGIWFAGTNPALLPLQKGDSVSVTGTVIEQFEVTQIASVSAVTVHASGTLVPQAADALTGDFGSFGNGTPSAEQWEGMAARISNATITNLNPTFADLAEYEISDGTTPMLVRTDGKSIYSNVIGDTSIGKTILKVGDRFDAIQGIVWFSFNRYKLVPRGDADFIPSIPSVPTLASPAAGAVGQPLDVVLAWNHAAVATSYQLQVAIDSAFTSPFVNDSSLTDTSKQMSGLTGATKYYWKVRSKNAGVNSAYSPIAGFTTEAPSGVETAGGIPVRFALDQNYPNPFNPSTIIRYSLPTRSHVRLQIFNMLGQKIAALADGEQEARYYEVTWNASSAASGLYFARLEAVSSTDARNVFVQVRKMVLMK